MRTKKGDGATAESRLESIEKLVDKIDRSIEKIELVTVVREPDSGLAADAYSGLRKQVIAAVSERNAHLQQLTQFDTALRSGATSASLAELVKHWLAQSAVVVLDDPRQHPQAFELVGDESGTSMRVVRPAYVDRQTDRVIATGLAELVTDAEAVTPPPGDPDDSAVDDVLAAETEEAR